MMSYNEFVEAIKNYLTAPATTGRIIFLVSLAVILLLLAIWFIIYLRKEYLRKKSETDTFNSDFAKQLDYPGFHPGGAPQKKDEKTRPKHDPWGDINDEY